MHILFSSWSLLRSALILTSMTLGTGPSAKCKCLRKCKVADMLRLKALLVVMMERPEKRKVIRRYPGTLHPSNLWIRPHSRGSLSATRLGCNYPL